MGTFMCGDWPLFYLFDHGNITYILDVSSLNAFDEIQKKYISPSNGVRFLSKILIAVK